MVSRVIGDAFPEQAKNDEVAMLRMNTRSSQFNHLRAKRLENLKLELLRAVVAAIRRRVMPGLQSVCADDIGGGQMLDDEMIANGIERIFVKTGRVGLLKPFVEFEVEDLKAQRLCRADFIRVAGEPRAVMGW